MSTPEPNDKPPPELVAGASPEPPPTAPESIKLEPRPVPQPRSVPVPDTSMSVATMVAVGLCGLLSLLPLGFMRDGNSYGVWVLPVVFTLVAVGGVAGAKGGPGAGWKQAIAVVIAIAIPLALFVYLFMECSETFMQ
jgi:hypothetical protein